MEPIIRMPARQSKTGCVLPVLMLIAVLLASLVIGGAWMFLVKPGTASTGRVLVDNDRMLLVVKETPPAKTREGQEADLAKTIAQSRWWKAKVSAADVNRMADAIVALNANEWLFIDDEGVVHPSENTDPLEYINLRNFIKSGIPYAPEGEIMIYLDGRKISKRLDRLTALYVIQQQTATMEFRGPRP